MNTVLADCNLLVALVVSEHVHHMEASKWFESSDTRLATCPITEGTLLRFLIREGQTADQALGVLNAIRSQEWHEFWPDELAYDQSMLKGVIGHRQVTDAYLVALARNRNGQLATFDRGLHLLHGEPVIWLKG